MNVCEPMNAQIAMSLFDKEDLSDTEVRIVDIDRVTDVLDTVCGHMAVLANGSDYFRAVATFGSDDAPKRTHATVVHCKRGDHVYVREVIRCIYDGSVSPEYEDDIPALIKMVQYANQIQAVQALSVFSTRLEKLAASMYNDNHRISSWSAESCIRLLSIPETVTTHSLKRLQSLLMWFLQERMHMVTTDTLSVLMHLSPEKMEELVRNAAVTCESCQADVETNIFFVVLQWLCKGAGVSASKQERRNVLTWLRYGEMFGNITHELAIGRQCRLYKFVPEVWDVLPEWLDIHGAMSGDAAMWHPSRRLMNTNKETFKVPVKFAMNNIPEEQSIFLLVGGVAVETKLYSSLNVGSGDVHVYATVCKSTLKGLDVLQDVIGDALTKFKIKVIINNNKKVETSNLDGIMVYSGKPKNNAVTVYITNAFVGT